jgi:hypothetical protein
LQRVVRNRIDAPTQSRSRATVTSRRRGPGLLSMQARR